ncbi:MAG: hypothetical protein GXO90_00845 [FCB group bacterium]|nr:hypothetical protein [FCB group bacterium]
MKHPDAIIDFILKEWLLIASGVGFVLTSIYAKNIPIYSIQEYEVLFVLFTLFVTVNGLQHSGLIVKLSHRIEQGKAIPIKLVAMSFFLSMVVTNDVALLAIVPLTLALRINHKDILVILEALAANAGSALTPFGNPQNLFIYWFYGIQSTKFVATIAPFSITLLLVLAVSALFVKTDHEFPISSEAIRINKLAYSYGVLLFLVILIVLHVLPILSGLVVFVFVFLFDRKTLRVDYALLFSFLFFFGVAENLRILLVAEIHNSGHIFLFSALVSQIMSNVPATLLFAKFTPNWEALLWGTNVGGFGSLVGSFANLIAYRLYITHERTSNPALFTVKFLIMGYAAFLLSVGLYFFLFGT